MQHSEKAGRQFWEKSRSDTVWNGDVLSLLTIEIADLSLNWVIEKFCTDYRFPVTVTTEGEISGLGTPRFPDVLLGSSHMVFTQSGLV